MPGDPVPGEPTAGLARVGQVVAAAVRDGGVPGAVAAVGRGPVTLSRWVTGLADATPGSARPMAAGTLFDLASLTKVVATTTTVLALTAAGRLGLDDRVARYLPGFTALRDGAVTIRQLLTHTSGLPDSRKFYEWCSSRDELLHDLFATPLEAPPGTRVTYSDLGFLALGEIVTEIAGDPLDAAVRELVTAPLGMTSTGYTPLSGTGLPGTGLPGTGRSGASNSGTSNSGTSNSETGLSSTSPSDPGRAAAPEAFAATERRADGTPWNGIVHDENARLMGGVAGHAGLFSTVTDLAAFCAWWVSDADGPVPTALRREAESCQTAGLGGDRGLGWVRTGDRFDILAGSWPASAVSHSGFTGTSLALDSPSGVWAILLTNSVHFGRDATAVKALRRNFHAAAASACFQ